MKKNVAGQVIGAQMTTAADGTDFTGAVTVYVTGDAGTQAAGSVGAGACTHEGNGFHTYAPAQAETNYDHVAFTFVGSGAVTQSVQLYPSFPLTGDAFSRLGAPAGASVSADIAALLAAILVVDDYVDTEIAAMPASVWAYTVEGSYTAVQLLRIALAALAGKLSGAATTTVSIRDTGDTKNRIVATVDADGNRSAVTLDGT